MKNMMFIVLLFLGACGDKEHQIVEGCAESCVGSTGPQGPKGEKGEQGLQGIQGVSGPQGIQGIQGVPGVKGLDGIQGNPGPAGPTGSTGSQGVQGPMGVQGPRGLQGIQGVQGPKGVPGTSIVVLNATGQEMGVPIPWRSGNGGEAAILMHREEADNLFPEGWIIPEASPSDLFYTGLDCSGIILARPLAMPPLFQNFLYWVPSFPTLAKKTGTVVTAAQSSRAKTTGRCLNGNLPVQLFDQLEDSGFRMVVSDTKPWTAVLQ